jgi:flagellar biosynthesis protein
MSDERDRPGEAAALSYEPGQTAPRVVASGRGLLAERIIAAAREAGVPVRSDPALARALAALDLGEEVPEAMYRAVAETLAWAYKLDAQTASLQAGRPREPPR